MGGDEQPDWPNSRTVRNVFMHLLHIIFFFLGGVVINTTAYLLGCYSLHLLIHKSSMPNPRGRQSKQIISIESGTW